MSVPHPPPPSTPMPPTGQPRLLDRVREAIRVRHYSLRTEQAYVDWVRRFILFHHNRHPLEMGATEINQFLTHLAVEGHVSASTQKHGKGGKDRRTMLPDSLQPELRAHLDTVRLLHQKDLARGFGSVLLPNALDRKLPAASTDWRWQFVFPSANWSIDPRSGQKRRHHAHEGSVGREITAAVARAGLSKRATSHSFRHSFATHLLEAGYDIRTVQAVRC